jgi:hypothetical protein
MRTAGSADSAEVVGGERAFVVRCLTTPEADDAAMLRLAALADEPLWAWHAHKTLANGLWRQVQRLSRQYVRDLATTLATHESAPAPQLIALTLAAAATVESGWTTHWRELVAGLRRHEHQDVRLAALNTFTSRES